MNSVYNFNMYIKGIVSGSLEWPLYTGLTVYSWIYCFIVNVEALKF